MPGSSSRTGARSGQPSAATSSPHRIAADHDRGFAGPDIFGCRQAQQMHDPPAHGRVIEGQQVIRTVGGRQDQAVPEDRRLKNRQAPFFWDQSST